MGVRCYCDVRELYELFGGGIGTRYQIARKVDGLFCSIFHGKDLVWNESSIVYLKFCQFLGNCNHDYIQATVRNFGKLGIFYHLLDQRRLDSEEFVEYAHGFDVPVPHCCVHRGSGLCQDG